MVEQSSDPWRTSWRLVTSDAVLVALLLALAVSVTLTAWIPQQPSSDEDYARWLSETQARFGQATSVMRTVGMFNIVSSFAFRALLALLSGSLFLRLVEALDRLRRGQGVEEPDGEWRQVSDSDLGNLLDGLGRRRYRVVSASSFFQVDRWPWSGVFPLLVHLGALLLLASLLLFHLFGWQEGGLILQEGERRSLPGNDNWVTLVENGGGTRHSPGVVAFLEESGPGVQVSARGIEGDPLPLLLTSDAEPSTDLQIALTGDTYFAIPDEALVVRLMPKSKEPYSQAEVQIYGSPTGEVISERTTEKGGQATFNVEGVTLTLSPAPYGRVIATHNPGRVPAALGLIILVIGLLGSLLWSERRFWLREVGAAVEAHGALPSWLRYKAEGL